MEEMSRGMGREQACVYCKPHGEAYTWCWCQETTEDSRRYTWDQSLLASSQGRMEGTWGGNDAGCRGACEGVAKVSYQEPIVPFS